MNKLAEFTRPFKIIVKRILSYSDNNLELDSYPIEFRKQNMVEELSKTNLIMFPWNARIINWYWMSGSGNTKTEAYLKLKESFEKYKIENKILPRPGKKVEIKFASVLDVNNYEQEAIQFFDQVFDMDYAGIFISDESSLYDFCWTNESLSIAKEKINNIYRINIDETEGLKIVNILKRIKN